MVGQVDYLTETVGMFCRLKNATVMGDLTEIDVPNRFIFLLLGSMKNSNIWEFQEMGRTMGTLLSDRVCKIKRHLWKWYFFKCWYIVIFYNPFIIIKIYLRFWMLYWKFISKHFNSIRSLLRWPTEPKQERTFWMALMNSWMMSQFYHRVSGNHPPGWTPLSRPYQWSDLPLYCVWW